MIKHVNIRVFGRVQGVCFRACARDVAMNLGLNGFVRNMPDGSVYMEAEGEEENVRKFIDWARRGPPAARVENIEVSWGDGSRNPKGFEIRYW